MKRIVSIYVLLLCCLSLFADEIATIYSWTSSNGKVTEVNGKIASNTNIGTSYINYCSSNYYTVCLIGKKENVNDTDGSYYSTKFTITLADGNTFKKDDEIEITAMRNNDDGGKANIYFLYGNGTTVDDTNVWANLGLMHEMTISGGTEAKTANKESRNGGSTEPLAEYSLYPSTNTFVVPESADGSTSLTLTRNDSECLLYITKIVITHSVPTDINCIKSETSKVPDCFNLCGQRTSFNDAKIGGVIIVNGKKRIR